MNAPIAPSNHPHSNQGQSRIANAGNASEIPGSPLLGKSHTNPHSSPPWMAAATIGHTMSQNLSENLFISSAHPTPGVSGAGYRVRTTPLLCSRMLFRDLEEKFSDIEIIIAADRE